MENLGIFRHRTSVHVRFSDIDVYGHVNNARFLSYLEEARMSYYREVLFGTKKLPRLGVILAHTCIDYLRPVFLGDTLEVLSRVAKLGNKSYTMEYVFLKNQEEIVAKAEAVIVSFDFTQNRTVPWSETIRKKIITFEGANVEVR